LRFQGTCFRAHDPKWAFSPLSGDGAKTHGGRFNPKGVPALYLALTIDGMIVEMTHGFAHRLDPLTICSYQVDVDDVIDLKSDHGRKANGVALAALVCAWADDVANGRYPASWTIADRLIAQGAAGVLVPSFAVGAKSDMTNLVLWRWGPSLPHRVEVHDPSGRLPKDQTSWPSVP
jgi:RES domain-containing protein